MQDHARTWFIPRSTAGPRRQILEAFPVLAARYKRPLPIAFGILFATLANHALAAWLGAWITNLTGREAMRWILGGSFLAMAAWSLVPDKLDEVEAKSTRFGAFGATLAAFFLVEMGDKTQVATVALAARYVSIATVVAGSTLGMMLANVPAVYVGERLLRRVPAKALRRVAAAIFALLGALALADPKF